MDLRERTGVDYCEDTLKWLVFTTQLRESRELGLTERQEIIAVGILKNCALTDNRTQPSRVPYVGQAPAVDCNPRGRYIGQPPPKPAQVPEVALAANAIYDPRKRHSGQLATVKAKASAIGRKQTAAAVPTPR